MADVQPTTEVAATPAAPVTAAGAPGSVEEALVAQGELLFLQKAALLDVAGQLLLFSIVCNPSLTLSSLTVEFYLSDSNLRAFASCSPPRRTSQS